MVPEEEQCQESGCECRATKYVDSGKDSERCPAHANVSAPTPRGRL